MRKRGLIDTASAGASRSTLAWVVFSASLLLCPPGFAAKPYLEKNRINYIARSLQAFRETSFTNIFNTYRYINVVDRNNCRSRLSDLRVECMLSFAKKNCESSGGAETVKNCQLYSDIIVVNKLSENIFVDRNERYRILKNSGYEFRTAMENRMLQKYARIVAQFYLTVGSECADLGFQCLAGQLDRFCLDYTNKESLSWQYCTSASLWFIGTSKKH